VEVFAYPGPEHVTVLFRDVTDRNKAEEALRASEANYRAIFDAVNDALFVHDLETGDILDANPTMTRIYGYALEEARHLKVEDLSAGEPPYTQEDALRWIRKAAEGEPQLFEWKARDKAGRMFWVEVNLKRAGIGGRDRLLAVVRDITERKKAEEALGNERRRLQAVLEALPVGMVITDAKGGLVMANSAYEQIWRGPRPRTESVRDYAAYKARWADSGKPLAPEEWASAQAVQRGKAVFGQLLEIERFDGSHAFVINSAAPVRDAEGRIVGSAVAIQDITALRETEEALREEQEHKLEFYRRTIMAATDGKLVITEPAEIRGIAGPAVASWEIHTPEDIKVIRHGVEDIARSAGIEEPRLGQLAVAVGEATTNVVKHAGKGEASLHRTEDALVAIVSDRGPGIPALTLPDVALRPGYSTTGTLGMGYKMMIQFADKVYLATGPEGTTVGIEMKLHPVEPPLCMGLMEKAGL
jgi:PAS domain S-box-containing protein